MALGVWELADAADQLAAPDTLNIQTHDGCVAAAAAYVWANVPEHARDLLAGIRVDSRVNLRASDGEAVCGLALVGTRAVRMCEGMGPQATVRVFAHECVHHYLWKIGSPHWGDEARVWNLVARWGF